MRNLILYIICLILGGAGAWLVSGWGMTLGLLDRANERSSHEGVVPKGGGIGILAAFFVCSIALCVPKSFWIPAVFISLISLWGDRFEISPRKRLLFQFAAGVILSVGILQETEAAVGAYALIPVFVVFVVGTANFFNFMDGINGIAGITGMVGFGLLSWFAVVQGADPRIILLCVCICLACLGFLPFNMPMARVFMGDTGSILLGFVFAGIVVWISSSFLDFVCAAAFLFPFYADELTTMTERLKNRESLMSAHRRHVYQVLANEGSISQWKISVGYGMLQLVVGISIILVKDIGSIAVISMLVIYFLGFVALSFRFRRGFEN